MCIVPVLLVPDAMCPYGLYKAWWWRRTSKIQVNEKNQRLQLVVPAIIVRCHVSLGTLRGIVVEEDEYSISESKLKNATL